MSESDFDDRREGKRKRKDKDRHDSKNKKDTVCRDFLRNICDRGATCKYEHPSDRQRRFSFCHDYQHGYCHRYKNCKFIHASSEDEARYLKTGQLPPHLTNWREKQCRSSPDATAVPYCKKYLYGSCWSENCRYKHVTSSEYRKLEGRSPSPPVDIQSENMFQRQVLPYCKSFMWENHCDDNCRSHHISRSEFRRLEGRSPTPPNNRSSGDMFEKENIKEFENNKFRTDFYEPEIKRPYIVENNRLDDINVNGFENSMAYQNRSQSERNYIMLEEENMMLRERIIELKKRIDELQVTNEFLLEQNARLRLQQDKNAAGLTAMTVPAVTITNSVPGANQIQQNPTPQQMVTAALRTVTASVATVPVSIDTVTPVSLGTVSMAPVQQMQGSVMTIAQHAPEGPPSGERQIAPQPLPISISAPSVPLVSYPLMSRTVMQQPGPPPPPPTLRHLTPN